MASTRLFVGNLPTDISENDIENEFAAYGAVEKVEVKHKRDPLTNDVMSTFAFVMISVTESDLNQCLREFKSETFRGRYLTVSVARENFMEKLKREREEATQTPSVNRTPEAINIHPEKLKIRNRVQVTQTNSVDDESSKNVSPKRNRFDEGEIRSTMKSSNPFGEPESIVKRKSNTFLENGKIKIPSINGSIIVPPSTKIEPKNLDEKSLKADKKRKDSLIKMKDTYNQQKRAVQQSLAGIGKTPQNKKIVFDAPDNDIGNDKNESKPLFEDDEDDDSNYESNFEIKKQYEGEKGARLQKLQSRFQNDQRFNMNEHFLDDIEDEEVDEKPLDQEEVKNDERKWQYDMLESVMGKKCQPGEKKKSDNPMLRYDPTRNDHVKYEKVAKRKATDNNAEPSTKHKKMNDEANNFTVSKDQFYKVTNQLTSILAPASEGFSLLSMFGRGTDATEKETKKPYREILMTKGQQKSALFTNTFNDESSDDEIIQERLAESKTLPVNQSKQINSKKTSKSEIRHEPFFIFGNDQRLQDGLSLFLPNSSSEGNEGEFEIKQKEMRNILKKKIKKSIRSVIPRGGKPNKRFGRLVKSM